MLHEFTSRIDGKNATVRIFEDHIEWTRKGHSLKSILWTVGLVLLIPARGHSETIPLRSISSVSLKPSGFFTELNVRTGTGVITLRTSKDNAEYARNLIMGQLAK